MKLVKEHINFERGLDPKEAMRTGKYSDPLVLIKEEIRKNINNVIKKYNISEPKIKELQNDKKAIAIQFNVNARMRFIVRYEFNSNWPGTITQEIYNHPQHIKRGSWKFIFTGGADDVDDIFRKLEERIQPRMWKAYARPLKRIKKNLKYAI